MKRHLYAILLLALLIPTLANADVAHIDSSGRSWRQLTDTLGLTWFDVITVCDVNTGACAGAFGAVDFSGWHWADVATVNELFNEFSAGAGFNDPSPQEYEILDSTWAPLLIDNDAGGPDTGTFNMTALFSEVDENVLGWTRDKMPDPDTGAYLGRIVNTPTFDKLQTDDVSDIDEENPDIVGFWLYQPATVIPIPAGFWLFGSALAGLGFARRRPTQRQPQTN
jgi:hypothetical protein